MKQKVFRAGKHSLAVIVPADFVHSLGIKAGDTVNVRSDIERGIIRVKFAGSVQLSLPTSSKKA